jgi:tetratricopeptide (TPR) repeat protein
VSHSPEDPSDEDQRAAFTQANQQLGRLAEQGFSWSGNERNCAFLNIHGGPFANVSAVTGFNFLDDGRSLALVDWDFDGDLDVWSGNRTSPRVRFVRNDAPGDNHFVAFALEGKSSNRDGIGARLEVVLEDTPDETLIRTLRAGEGFLGQSSKRIHFGLGSSQRIARVTVRWPGAAAEDFEGVEADGFYRLVQGQGRALNWTPPQRELALKPDEIESVRTPGKARIFLSSRLPLPRVDYQTFAGVDRSPDHPFGSPMLINLWASWCQPCMAELAELGREKDRVDAVGLRVLALSVDGLGTDEASSVTKAAALMERLALPFESGLASTSTVDTLQIAHDLLLAQRRPLPVPTSFLLDSQGRIAVIYKGQVDVDQLLKDVATLELDDDEQRRAALPFPGRWMSPLNRKARLLPLLLEMAAADHLSEAADHAYLHRATLVLEPGFAGFLRQMNQALRQRLEDTPSAVDQVSFGIVNGLQGDPAAAASAFREALHLAPGSMAAAHGLARALGQTGDYGQALKHFQTLIEAHPQETSLYASRATLYSSIGNRSLAAADTARALGIQPQNAAAHLAHAQALHAAGEVDEAFAHTSSAIELAGDLARARLLRGQIHAARGDYARAAEDLLRSTRLVPEDPSAQAELAWLLATCPDENLRDGAEALVNARRAGELSGWHDAPSLQAFAAAQAETGAFESAVEWQTRAIEAAPTAQRARYRAVLQSFESGRPYRTSPTDQEQGR